MGKNGRKQPSQWPSKKIGLSGYWTLDFWEAVKKRIGYSLLCKEYRKIKRMRVNNKTRIFCSKNYDEGANNQHRQEYVLHALLATSF